MAEPLTLLHGALTSQDPLVKNQFAQAVIEQPASLPTICATLLPSFRSFDSVTRAWIIRDVVEVALGKAPLSSEQKTQIALQSLDHLVPLLQDSSFAFRKIALQTLASAYPLLFRHCCQQPGDASTWNRLTAAKNLALNSWSSSSNIGVRVAATRCVQRVIQTQTRASVDPRLARMSTDANLSLCPPSHPNMNASSLEDEAKRLLEDCIKLLYISNLPELVSAVVTSFATLAKQRPVLSNSIFISLVNWEPTSLASATPLHIRSVEKTFRISLAHLLKTGHAGTMTSAVTEFLQKQNMRMTNAADQLRRAKAEAQRKRSVLEEPLQQQQQPEAGPSGETAKRRRIEGAEAFTTATAAAVSQSQNPMAGFDVKQLPLPIVTELIMASFQAISQERITQAIEDIRHHLPKAEEGPAAPPVPPADDLADENEELQIVQPDEAITTGEDADMGALDDFELPEPDLLSEGSQMQSLFQLSIERICTGPKENVEGIWAPMLIRLVTRGQVCEAQKASIREALYDVVRQKPEERLDLARTWLSEEWLALNPSDASGTETPYATWLSKVVELVDTPEMTKTPTFKTTFSSFVLDMPLITSATFDKLSQMCQASKDRLQVGFTTLRELATLRPLARQRSLDLLLSLTTHYAKPTRNGAIITVKRWVPDQAELGAKVLDFAQHLLCRVRDFRSTKAEDQADMELDGGDSEKKPEPQSEQTFAQVQEGRIVGGLPPISSEAHLQQHLELLLALCTKNMDLLDELVLAYSQMDAPVQGFVQSIITPLIRSMGPTNPKTLSLIRNTTPGAESLVLRILTILTDNGVVPPSVSGTIEEMASEKDLNPRLLVPVLRDFSKSEIVRALPRIASLLSNPEDKPLVRSLFESIMVSPHTFGTISTNMPRLQQSELLTPVDLLITLHHQDKELGIKLTREAISLCMSGMSEIFRPEVLAAFMQQMLDEPVLPMLFLSTVISAVTLHRSLQPYVSSTLLMRLITKKIWSTPQLWEGFIRCAKITQPHSFDALLQLPREPFLQVMQKQPSLLSPLREFAAQRYAGKPKLNTLLEWLSEADQSARQRQQSGTPQPVPV